MSKLPLVISVPHAGLRIPDEVADICMRSAAEIAKPTARRDLSECQSALHHRHPPPATYPSKRRSPPDARQTTLSGTIHYRHLRDPKCAPAGRQYAPYHQRLTYLGTSRMAARITATPGRKRPRPPDPGKPRDLLSNHETLPQTGSRMRMASANSSTQ